MFAAAAAALAGAASAALCDSETVADSCSVYNLKFSFKTLAAKKACNQGAKWLVTTRFAGAWNAVWVRSDTADAAATVAAGGREPTAADYIGVAIDPVGVFGNVARAARREVYWMDNATRKFEGILWQCHAACFEGLADLNPNNNGRINFALWEKKSSLALSFPIVQVKVGTNDGDALKDILLQEYASFDEQNNFWLGRYGKSAQKIAAYWQPALRNGQFIGAAGFGTFDGKNLRIKSISGNAVGMIAPLNEALLDACGNVGNFFCAVGFLCVDWRDWCCDGCYAGVEVVPASGNWSLKYNASATKKANNDKATLRSFVPDYMFYTHANWAAFRNADPLLHTDNYYWIDNATGAAFYKGGTVGEAAVTLDMALDNITWKNQQIINIVGQGTPIVDDEGALTGYNYQGKEFQLADGALSEDDLEDYWKEDAE